MSYFKRVKAVARQKKQPPKSSAKKKYTLWFGIFFFVSAWMFVLGVLVGRGTAPVQFDVAKLQSELAAIKEAVLKEKERKVSFRTESFQKEPELGFYEALKDTRDQPEKSELLPKLSRKKGSTKSQVIQPRLREKAITPAPDPVPQKTLSIQVASLKKPQVADGMVVSLKAKGYPAYRVVGKIPNKGTWYRVRIGYFQNRSQAEGMLKRLRQDKIKGIIVRR